MLLKKSLFSFLLVILLVNTLQAQKDSTLVKNIQIKKEIVLAQGVYNPLSPAKAAFYSAIFPGMGQIYNKKYWKAPIVWGALAIPTYFYLDNNSEYKRYRTAFRLRKNGFQDEFTLDDGSELLSLEGLERAQEQLRENRDLSLLSAVILYALQIVEASVNAHLLQFNIDDNLSFKPTITPENMNFAETAVGFTLKYDF